MSDEIRDQNVVRVFKDGNTWLAVVGPYPGAGVMASGRTARLALFRLFVKLTEGDYLFDPSWTPAPNRTDTDTDA